MGACIKFTKRIMKKCFDTGWDVRLALLQITLTLVGPGLPNPAVILFNRPIQGILPKIKRAQIFYDYDNHHYTTFKKGQDVNDKNKDASEIIQLYPLGLQWQYRKKMMDPGHMVQ